MTTIEINRFKTDAVIALGEERVADAIKMIRELPASSLDASIRSELDSVSEHYRYMLQYFAAGAPDPHRDSNRRNIISCLRMIVDRCVRNMTAEHAPTQYYGLVRTFALNRGRTLRDVVERYAGLQKQLSEAFDVMGLDGHTDSLRKESSALEHEMFERTWVEFPLSKSSYDILRQIFELDSGYSRSLRTRLINATGIGLLEFFDEQRMSLLADILDYSEDDRETVLAMAWLLIALFRFRKRLLPAETEERLRAAAEHPLWQQRLRHVYIEMIRARDTERITRHMRDELMPDLMRLNDDLLDERTRNEMLGDIMSDAEINPEWEDKLRESGMYDRMRELSEMTGSGSDVFMGAFSHLKQFPFFSRIDSWFMPFDESQSDVSAALSGEMSSFVALLCRLPMPCDNDKFSILFSLGAGSPKQREIIARQLESNQVAMTQAGMQKADLETIARTCVQNIYRFFKLYGRHSEFFDPFARRFMLGNGFIGDEITQEAAELLFKSESWEDARQSFGMLIDRLETVDAGLYQKSGYCSEQLGEYNSAAESYQLADLIDGSSTWTLRRLAAMLRRTGRPGDATDPLRRLCRLSPGSTTPMLNLAFSLIENREYSEASEILGKLEELGGDTSRLWRAQAWTAFMTDDMDRARKYYQFVESDNPTAQDYMNMGHFAWAENRMQDAIAYYRKSMIASGCSPEEMRESIRADFRTLVSKGIDRTDLPLIMDAVVLG